jgi:predicted metal-dependent hydrolase
VSGITVRKPVFDFPGVPRHWFAGSVLATHTFNGLNLLFPLGERFFIRSVRAFADRIDDPKLAEDIRAFIAQEVRHGMEHERFFENIEAHGFEIRRFLAVYEKVVFGVIEPLMPKKLRLAATAAAEHFTATFAEGAFQAELLAEWEPPVMRDLMLWHAAEEIEHKAVAFDVLKKVDPSYSLRMAGLLLSTVILAGFWTLGTAMLLAQDERVSLRRLRLERGEAKKRNEESAASEMARAFLQYLRPDFHPSDNANEELARAFLDSRAFA